MVFVAAHSARSSWRSRRVADAVSTSNRGRRVPETPGRVAVADGLPPGLFKRTSEPAHRDDFVVRCGSLAECDVRLDFVDGPSDLVAVAKTTELDHPQGRGEALKLLCGLSA